MFPRINSPREHVEAKGKRMPSKEDSEQPKLRHPLLKATQGLSEH